MRRHLGRTVAVIGAAVCLVGAAACSSSNSGASGSSGSSGTSKADAPFAAAVKTYEKGLPASFGGPATSPGPVPKHASIWIIVCDSSLSGCTTPAQYAETAAQHLGWSVKIFNGNSDPTTQISGMLDAVAAKANAIITVSVQANQIQQGLEAASKAHIPVISVSQGTGTPNPAGPALKYNFTVDVSADYPVIGKMMADAAIADTDAKGDILVMEDREQRELNVTAAATLAELDKCKTCTIEKPVTFVVDNVASGSLGQITVGYLQAHPNVNMIISPYDPAAAVQVEAIDNAGLQKHVKIVSVVGAPQNLAYIRAGNVEVADVAEGNNYLGYAAIDQTIRLLNHKPVSQPNSEDDPLALLESNNLPAPKAQWGPSFDFASSYYKLWGVG
jgi:ABC-type sugar transport system substrate-binding protein